MASRALSLPDAVPLALDLPSELTFEQWEAEGRRLSQTSHALQWYIGDWWNAGERFGDERRAETAKRLFGVEYGTVRNYGSVAGRVPLSLRSDDLPYSAFRELASLPRETLPDMIQRAVNESLPVRELRREVRALRVVGGTESRRAAAPPEPAPIPKNELTEAYGRFVEAMEALETFRPLTRREQDFLALALEHLGEAHAERRPIPDDFEVIFVEQGRLACEPHYRASRITVNRWLLQAGKQRLIDARARFVKFQRAQATKPQPADQAQAERQADTYLPVAKMAADWLRISRYGGWRITQHPNGGWLVGTVHRTSEELIDMAVRQGFDREAAVTEAQQEGY